MLRLTTLVLPNNNMIEASIIQVFNTDKETVLSNVSTSTMWWSDVVLALLPYVMNCHQFNMCNTNSITQVTVLLPIVMSNHKCNMCNTHCLTQVFISHKETVTSNGSGQWWDVVLAWHPAWLEAGAIGLLHGSVELLGCLFLRILC